jgi:osmotically-inducible protein OsmY
MVLTSRRLAVTAALLIALGAVAASAATPRAPQTTELTQAFRDAGVTLANLHVFEVGGIVLIRGVADDKATAESVGLVARQLGYERVANLIRVVEAPDDEVIRRKAEVELSMHRSLDGCRFTVESKKGVLLVSGQVRHELQKDAAMQLLRSIDGVREVHVDLARF